MEIKKYMIRWQKAVYVHLVDGKGKGRYKISKNDNYKIEIYCERG
jgi:hypothetical protein